MKILLVCSGGFTTSLLADNMRKALTDPNDIVDAGPVSEVKNLIDKYDIVLIGPQIRFKFNEIQKIAQSHGKKAGLLNPQLLSTLDGAMAVEAAKKLSEGQ
jgi:PTS system cellobiose-specific IIB component